MIATLSAVPQASRKPICGSLRSLAGSDRTAWRPILEAV